MPPTLKCVGGYYKLLTIQTQDFNILCSRSALYGQRTEKLRITADAVKLFITYPYRICQEKFFAFNTKRAESAESVPQLTMVSLHLIMSQGVSQEFHTKSSHL